MVNIIIIRIFESKRQNSKNSLFWDEDYSIETLHEKRLALQVKRECMCMFRRAVESFIL